MELEEEEVEKVEVEKVVVEEVRMGGRRMYRAYRV